MSNEIKSNDIHPQTQQQPLTQQQIEGSSNSSDMSEMDEETKAAMAAINESINEEKDEKSIIGPHPEGTNLIVNYLPPLMNDDSLKNLFRQFGTIVQSKVIKNKATMQSLGYGFVRFDNEESAKKAIAAINGITFENKRLKVAIAKPSVKKTDEQTNLYFSGLPLNWGKNELDELVRAYGTIAESRVMINLRTNESKGVGFVRLDSYESALKTILSLNGKTLDGATKKLNVKFAAPPKVQPQYAPIHQTSTYSNRYNPLSRFGGSPASFSSSLLASSLAASSLMGASPNVPQLVNGSVVQPQSPSSTSTTSASTTPASFFQPYILDPQAYYSQGVNGMNMMGMGGFPMSMMVGMPGMVGMSGMGGTATPNNGTCIFVYHLPPDCTDTTLQSLFSTCGQVLSVRVMKNLATGQSKGYGFVNMMTTESAQFAIEKLDGYPMGNKRLKVSLKTLKDGKTAQQMGVMLPTT